MSAKSIFKKIRGIYVKIATRKLVGNFRHEKYWSDEVREFMENRESFSFVGGDDDSIGSIYVGGVRNYFIHFGNHDLQAVNLALSLLKDIYALEVLPMGHCEEIFGRKETAEFVGKELFGLLCKFGGMDIVYHDAKHRVPKGIRNRCQLNRRLYLTDKPVGMPVGMFLIWAKGGVPLPPEIMAEWSGIPKYKVADVYSALIKEFKYDIIDERNWDRAVQNVPKIGVAHTYMH